MPGIFFEKEDPADTQFPGQQLCSAFDDGFVEGHCFRLWALGLLPSCNDGIYGIDDLPEFRNCVSVAFPKRLLSEFSHDAFRDTSLVVFAQTTFAESIFQPVDDTLLSKCLRV